MLPLCYIVNISTVFATSFPAFLIQASAASGKEKKINERKLYRFLGRLDLTSCTPLLLHPSDQNPVAGQMYHSARYQQYRL
jgi:hypothetical protein